MTDRCKEPNFADEGNQAFVDSKVNTGKVADVVNKGNQTIVNVAFMDGSRRTVVIPTREDIAMYKDKYVICSMNSDNVTNILEIVND